MIKLLLRYAFFMIFAQMAIGEEINAPLLPMLRASNLVYVFSNLRGIVRKNEKSFKQPELIFKQKPNKITFQTTNMNHVVTAEDVLKFIDLNRKYLKFDEDGAVVFDETGTNVETFYFEKGIDTLRRFDADIIEFDDRRANAGRSSELVYSVVVNRSEKRVTIVFRGSVNLRDWIQNVQFLPNVPGPIAEFDKNVQVHSGFSDYLFKYKAEKDENTKYEQILKTLEEVFTYKEDGKNYSDYSLFVTGHSLGGALSQILAFTLAGNKEARRIIPSGNPITALTYASPECGTKEYRKAFRKLEEENRLRHLRVSNQGDFVPLAISYFVRLRDFTQPGVNIHVFKNKKAKVAYNGKESNWWKNPLAYKKMIMDHNLTTYKFNLVDNGKNTDILEKTTDEFYEEYLFKPSGIKATGINNEL